MEYTLNEFFQSEVNARGPRVLVYPDRATAAHMVNHLRNSGSVLIGLPECLPRNTPYLPMPNKVLAALDEKIRASAVPTLVTGLDAYLELLDSDAVDVFFTGLRNRLDSGNLRVDYLLSAHHKPPFAPRYEESRTVICFAGEVENLKPFTVTAMPEKWAGPDDLVGYDRLLAQTDPFIPSGNYTLIIRGMSGSQAQIGSAVTFVTDTHEIASRRYGLDIDLAGDVLELLLLNAVKANASPEEYLSEQFGFHNCDSRHALKRLLELSNDAVWQAYIWLLKRRLPANSYMTKVLSEGVNASTLLHTYVVDTAISVLSDENVKLYAAERAEALQEQITLAEPLIVEFIEITRDCNDACLS